MVEQKAKTNDRTQSFSIFSHIGAVGKSMSKYAPIDTIENFKKKLAAQEAFINGNSVLNKITGETRKLSEIASTAEKRFAQMYTIMKGLDTYAKELGLKAAMITLTAPEKYHCNPKHGKNSWHLSNYADQKETQEWISENWNLVNMRLSKHNVEKYGLRISEAHTDSTNHWHSIIFYRAEHETIIKDAIADVWNLTRISYKFDLRKNVKKTKKYKYFTKSKSYEIAITAKMVTKKGQIKDEDKKEIGKIHHVLNKFSIAANFIAIDNKKGSAASYICKYISKSCLFDASKKSKFNDQDEDSVIQRNQKFENEYNALLGVAATRSTFNIRSFQFYGLPVGAISLWLMYRRQRNANLDNKMERLRRDAACNGDFCRFIKLIKENTPKIEYEERINGFGEIIKKATGYTVKHNSPINLFITKTTISDKTTFKYFDRTETFNVIKNDFMIVNNNDIFKLFDGETFNTNTVRVNHNVPSRCAENQKKKRDIRLMNNFYDDDPIFWLT